MLTFSPLCFRGHMSFISMLKTSFYLLRFELKANLNNLKRYFTASSPHLEVLHSQNAVRMNTKKRKWKATKRIKRGRYINKPPTFSSESPKEKAELKCIPYSSFQLKQESPTNFIILSLLNIILKNYQLLLLHCCHDYMKNKLCKA